MVQAVDDVQLNVYKEQIADHKVVAQIAKHEYCKLDEDFKKEQWWERTGCVYEYRICLKTIFRDHLLLRADCCIARQRINTMSKNLDKMRTNEKRLLATQYRMSHRIYSLQNRLARSMGYQRDREEQLKKLHMMLSKVETCNHELRKLICKK